LFDAHASIDGRRHGALALLACGRCTRRRSDEAGRGRLASRLSRAFHLLFQLLLVRRPCRIWQPSSRAGAARRSGGRLCSTQGSGLASCPGLEESLDRRFLELRTALGALRAGNCQYSIQCRPAHATQSQSITPCPAPAAPGAAPACLHLRGGHGLGDSMEDEVLLVVGTQHAVDLSTRQR
jgi:hypothetical protein